MKKRIVLLITAACILTLSGCSSGGSIYSNYREAKDLQLISTIGIDSAGDGTLSVTVSSGTQTENTPPTLLSQDASSISVAFEKLQDYASRESLYYAHTNYIVLGQEYMEQGIFELLDHVGRSTQIRSDVILFAVIGSTAKNLITGAGTEEYEITQALSSIERDVMHRGDSYVYPYHEIVRSLAEHGSALVCALMIGNTEGSEFAFEGTVTSLPVGYAVLKGDRLVGSIVGQTAIGINLLTDNRGDGVLLVSDGGSGQVSLTMRKSKCCIEPVWKDGEIEKLTVTADVFADIIELQESRDVDQKLISLVEVSLTQEITGWLEEIFELSSSTGADFLGLGRHIQNKDPVKYEKMSKSWETVLSELEVDITVSATVDITNNLRPSQINQKGGS